MEFVLSYDEVENLEARAKAVLQTVSNLEDYKARLKKEFLDIETAIVKTNNRLRFVGTAREFYLKAIDKVYMNAIKELETVANEALKFVFFDKEYELKAVISDRLGKSLDFMLKDRDLEVDLRDGVGNGVRMVLSFVFHYHYIKARGSFPVMLIDEGYSYISKEYFNRFAEFVQEFTKHNKLILVLISHLDFSGYASQTLVVNDGQITVVKEDV